MKYIFKICCLTEYKITSRFVLIFSILTSFIACNSPTRNKISQQDEGTKKSTSLFKLNNTNRILEFSWNYGPLGNLKIKNHLLVFIKDSSGKPQDLNPNEELEFYSSMPSMGHPLADPGYFQRIDVGIYLNKNIVYNMAGDWKNEIWISHANGKVIDEITWEDFF